MNIVIDIPDDIAYELTGAPANLYTALKRRIQVDLATIYYTRDIVSLGKAAELSGLSRGEFEAELAEQKIKRNLNLDLEEDLIHFLKK